MKKVYLDNCHLQRLSQDKNLIAEFHKRKYLLIISRTIIYEIAKDCDLRHRSNKIRFVESTPFKYLKYSKYLLKKDLFKSNRLDSPFSDDFNQSFPDKVIPRKKQRKLKNMTFGEIVRELGLMSSFEEANNFSVHNWATMRFQELKNTKHEADNQFKEKLLKKLNTFKLSKKAVASVQIEEFIKNKTLIPSFSIPYYVSYAKLNDDRKYFSEADMIWDTDQCEAIPYVDYFLTDKANREYINKAIHKLKLRNRAIISSHISDIFR